MVHARGDFALVGLPVTIQVAVGDVSAADVHGLSDLLADGVIERVLLGAAEVGNRLPGCEFVLNEK